MWFIKKSAHWKLYVGTIVLLALLQFVSLIIATKIYLSFSRSCTAQSGFLNWYCSGNADPTLWADGTALIAPVLLVKLLLYKLKVTISWKKLIALQIITFVTLYLIAIVAENPSCGCGG